MERPSRDAFATRFDTYVTELREVFASRNLRFGRPKDVAAVALALSAPAGVQEDVASVVRSILYREHEGLARAELASIMVVAAGGADLYASAQEGDAVAQLDAFLNGVRLSMRASARADRAQEAVEASASIDPEVRAAAEIPLRREEVYAEEDTNEVQELVAPRADRASMLAGVYAQATRMAEGGQESGAVGEGTYFLKAKAEKEVDSAPEEDLAETLEVRASGAYWGWIAGLCLLAVLLAAGLVWRHREMARVVAVAPEARPPAGGAGVAPKAQPPTGAASVGQTGSFAGTAVSRQTGAGQSGPAVAGVSPGGDGGRGADGLGMGGPGVGSGSQKMSAGEASKVSVDGREENVARLKATPSPEKPGGPAAKPVADAAPVPKPKAAAAPTTSAVAPAASAGAGLPASLGKYVVSSGVMSGHLISAPAPSYPKMAKMWEVEGQVILQAVISSKGKVVSAHVLDGHKMLRGSAMNAVRKWRYRPYLVDGKATDVATIVIVEYKLKP